MSNIIFNNFASETVAGSRSTLNQQNKPSIVAEINDTATSPIPSFFR
jgi:hypothetical protein